MFSSLMIEAKAAVNRTTSSGVKLSPTLPPMVPLIPDMDLIKVIMFNDF
jgi:hypothetical protein